MKEMCLWKALFPVVHRINSPIHFKSGNFTKEIEIVLTQLDSNSAVAEQSADDPVFRAQNLPLCELKLGTS